MSKIQHSILARVAYCITAVISSKRVFCQAGLTALHKAAIRGHSHAVRILLLYGADVELKTEVNLSVMFTPAIFSAA